MDTSSIELSRYEFLTEFDLRRHHHRTAGASYSLFRLLFLFLFHQRIPNRLHQPISLWICRLWDFKVFWQSCLRWHWLCGGSGFSFLAIRVLCSGSGSLCLLILEHILPLADQRLCCNSYLLVVVFPKTADLLPNLSVFE